jgi:hypothetical protein
VEEVPGLTVRIRLVLGLLLRVAARAVDKIVLLEVLVVAAKVMRRLHLAQLLVLREPRIRVTRVVMGKPTLCLIVAAVVVVLAL